MGRSLVAATNLRVGRSNRSGRAISPSIVENVTVPPSGGPSFDDCYTISLHNPNHDQALSVSERSGNPARDCYTNRLHKVRTHFVRRAGRLYYRRRVPEALQGVVGKREVWRSLGTDSPTVALRRSHQVAAQIERDFEAARSTIGLKVDQTILLGSNRDGRTLTAKVSDAPSAATVEDDGPTLGQVYDAYMSDPTRDWSPRTRLAYETTRRMVVAVLGEATPNGQSST
jgi:hypothetical protein